MLGLGAQATWVQLVLNSSLADCIMVLPTVDKLSACTSAQEVSAIPVPDEITIVGF